MTITNRRIKLEKEIRMLNKEVDSQTAVIWIISAVMSYVGGILFGMYL